MRCIHLVWVSVAPEPQIRHRTHPCSPVASTHSPHGPNSSEFANPRLVPATHRCSRESKSEFAEPQPAKLNQLGVEVTLRWDTLRPARRFSPHQSSSRLRYVFCSNRSHIYTRARSSLLDAPAHAPSLCQAMILCTAL